MSESIADMQMSLSDVRTLLNITARHARVYSPSVAALLDYAAKELGARPDVAGRKRRAGIDAIGHLKEGRKYSAIDRENRK